jgi:hypothetical protein
MSSEVNMKGPKNTRALFQFPKHRRDDLNEDIKATGNLLIASLIKLKSLLVKFSSISTQTCPTAINSECRIQTRLLSYS